MMDFLIICIGILLVYFTLLQSLALSGRRKSKKLPPGPRRLPIIGNLLSLGSNPHHSLTELAKIHGPIMSLKLGSVTSIIISSSQAAKETLHIQNLAFSTPYIPDGTTACNHSQVSIIWLPATAKWRSLRKSVYTNVFSTTRLDANTDLRARKVKEYIDFCRAAAEKGSPVDIGRAGFMSTLSLLCHTLFSVDLNSDSAKGFKQLVWDIIEEVGKPNVSDYFPVLKMIDPQGVRKRLGVHFEKMLRMFDEVIDERIESRKLRNGGADAGGNDMDSLDMWLNSNEENPDQQIDRIYIRHLFLDLFSAGIDSTASTLEWAMTELLRIPDIMSKAKAELELVIGKGKILEEANVSQLPYLQCILKETLRMHTPSPLLSRRVESDVEVNGFVLPKDSQVVVNMWAIEHDPSYWEDPFSFKPERFLNSDLDVRGQDFEFIPFGGGRRMCPGLPLVMRTMPTILGSLINSFDWKLEGGIEPKELDMEVKFGATLQKAQPLRAVPIPLMVD